MQFLHWHRSIPGLHFRPPNNPKHSEERPVRRSVATLMQRVEIVLPVPVRRSVRLVVKLIRVHTAPPVTKPVEDRQVSRVSVAPPMRAPVPLRPEWRITAIRLVSFAPVAPIRDVRTSR